MGSTASRVSQGVDGSPVAPVAAGVEEREPGVEPAVAVRIVVHADHVGRAGVLRDPPQLVAVGITDVSQVAVQRMPAVDAAAEQVESEPASVVLEDDLLGHRPRTAGAPEVLGLDQASLGRRLTDCLHGEDGGAHLGEQYPDEGGVVERNEGQVDSLGAGSTDHAVAEGRRVRSMGVASRPPEEVIGSRVARTRHGERANVDFRTIPRVVTTTGTSEELDLAEGPKGVMRGPDPQVSAGPGPFCVPSPARQRRTEMNIIDQAVWHGGGTSAPPRRARIGVTPGICGWHAVDVVPERAVEARRAARCARGRSHHRTRRRGDTRTPTPGAVFRSIRRIALAGH